MQHSKEFSIPGRIARLEGLRLKFERERAELLKRAPDGAKQLTEAIQDLEILIARLRQQHDRTS